MTFHMWSFGNRITGGHTASWLDVFNGVFAVAASETGNSLPAEKILYQLTLT